VADVANGRYNPGGRLRAAEYTFPYPDAAFDLVFLISVFPHLLPADLGRYVAEIARVLRRGGHCLATYFLLNAESRRLLAEGRAGLPLAHHAERWAVSDPANPEAAIAYDEAFVRDLHGRHGLRIMRADPGAWAGRPGALAYQDVLVARRE
jgi:SAM-dependent methyltransferase